MYWCIFFKQKFFCICIFERVNLCDAENVCFVFVKIRGRSVLLPRMLM